jgi:MOSC domain-containing protein YiiM
MDFADFAQVVSVNAGQVAELVVDGTTVESAIDKQPLSGMVAVSSMGIVGDEQADGRFHGGTDQALCVYPSEHYPHWPPGRGGVCPGPGRAGENLTTVGLDEDGVCIGDVLEIDGVIVQVSGPRIACHKPGAHNAIDDMKTFMKSSGRIGFYLRVIQTGELAAPGLIELLDRPHPMMTIAAAEHARAGRDLAMIEALAGLEETSFRYRRMLTEMLG